MPAPLIEAKSASLPASPVASGREPPLDIGAAPVDMVGGGGGAGGADPVDMAGAGGGGGTAPLPADIDCGNGGGGGADCDGCV